MAQTVKEVMTGNPRTLDARSSIQDAARMMLDNEIGDVIVQDDNSVCGIVTDRDITIRAIAQGKDPAKTKLGEICSKDLTMVSPTDDVDTVIQLMRDKAIRRVPVLETGKPVGILSLGDLAMERDPSSVLANVSAAPANT